MKRFVSSILLICYFLINCNVVFAFNESGDIIISNPAFTKGFTEHESSDGEPGLDTVSIFARNNSSKTVEIKLMAVKDEKEYYTDAQLHPNEVKKISVGFYKISEEEVFDIRVLVNNNQFTDFISVSSAEEFNLIYTNAENDFVIDNDIVLEYNSIITDIGEVHLIQNDTEIDCERNIITNKGKTVLVFTSKVQMLPNTTIKLILPDISDVFKRTIKGREILFNTVKVTDLYKIYQTCKVYSQAGIGGFAVLADFKDDTPKEVYFARQTRVPKHEADLPFMSSSIAVVVDPDGNIAAKYDFSEMSTGRQNIVLKLPYKKEGIWQFKFMSSRTGDILEIGLPDAENWGIRGETALGVTETTPKNSYIYVPEKVNKLYIGTTGTAVSVYDLNDELQMTTSPATQVFAKSDGRIEDIKEEKIYKLKLPEKFDGGIIVDRAPSLMCPTLEMAQSLKGGWTDACGILVQGNTQKALREYLVKYINEKNFEIIYEKPTYVRGTLQYPMAEALFFGGGGAISNLKRYSETQNFNIDSPYCGSFVSEDTPTWEDGSFVTTNTYAFSGLVNMDGELNAFYHNEGLINRCVISVLASLLMLSEDFMIKDNSESMSYPITHGNFYFSYTAVCYMRIRDLIDKETRDILDNAFVLLAYKQGNMRGHGVTNQWLFTVLGVTASAYATDDNYIKDILYRHLNGLVNGPYQGKGQSSSGYFIEVGCDGDYNNLSCHLFYDVYKTIKQEEPNNIYLPKLKDMVQKSLEFTSLFLLPHESDIYLRTNAAASRTLNDIGIDSHSTYTKVMDEFPLAKRRFELFGILNSEEKAHERIRKYIGPYTDFSNRPEGGNLIEFETYKNILETESELLPYEYNEGIWEKPGIIALKHKGLYMNVFYAVQESSVPSMSFMGGGLSLLYADGGETVAASRKHLDYDNIASYDQILASCVFGKKNDGSIFVTGKENAELEWIENGKCFRIKGITPDGIDIVWTYNLTDEGIEQTINALGDTSELWLNVPISNLNPKARCTHEPGKLKYSFNDRNVSFEWNEACDYYITEIEKVRCLRINISSGELDLKMSYGTEPKYGDIKIENVDINSDIDGKNVNVTLRNNAGQTREVQSVCAAYTKWEKLMFVSETSQELRENSVKTVNHKLPPDTEKVKVMLWDSFNGMFPFDIYNCYIE